jgi:HEAT repeat protein
VNYRRRGALLLAQSGRKGAVPYLVEALSDPDYLVRKRAAIALVNVGGPDDKVTIPALVESLSGEDDGEAYKAKVEAIAHFSGEEETISDLLSAYDGMDDKDREKLLFYLHDLVETNRVAFENLRGLFEDALELGDMKSRLLALSAFGVNGNPIDKRKFIKFLSGNDVNSKLIALQYLGKYRGEDVREALLESVKDRVGIVRAEALRTLLSFREKRDLVIFMRSAKDPYPQARRMAAKAMGIYRELESKPILRELLLDLDRGVRLEAAHSLALMGFHEGFDILVYNLRENSDAGERRLAIDGLCALKTRHAREYFRYALRDRDSIVREYARKGLERLGYRK